MLHYSYMNDVAFEPSVLKWAREKRFGPRTETANEKLLSASIYPDMVRQWEAGEAQPTFVQVKKLSEVYKRPLAVFFLSSPPEEEASPPDLRTIGSTDNETLSPEALLVMRKARRVQEVANELVEDIGERKVFKYARHTIADNPVMLARELRDDLGVTTNDQFKFKTYEAFFEYLREKLESTGIITLKSGMHDSFPVKDCRAFSFTDRQPYLILINNKDYEGAKIFSLMHEFGHILLGESGICNNFSSFGNGANHVSSVETFCNRFAANFLVPNEELHAHDKLIGHKHIDEGSLNKIAGVLAHDFKVSRFVVLRKLLDQGFISQTAYNERARIWQDEIPLKRGEGGTFSLGTVLKKNGARYTSLVFEAYRQKKIPRTSVSDYLGLKTKHLPGLERLVSRYAN